MLMEEGGDGGGGGQSMIGRLQGMVVATDVR